MKYTFTISAAEGGADARLFVKDLKSAYTKLFNRRG